MSPKARRLRRPAARTSPAAPFPPLLLALLIVVAGMATFWNSLQSPFIWDDQSAIVTNATIRDLGWPGPLAPPRETPVAGRPLVNLSFAINYALGGSSETGYHVGNLAVHIACALLLFGIVRRTLGGPEKDSRPRLVALAVALLWMLHPLQSEVVNYVTQRSESLMALCFLLTMYCAIRAREARQDTRAAIAPPWQTLAVLACACGMASKESMVVAPVVVILYDRAFTFRTLGEALGRRWRLYAGLAATWLVLGALVWTAPRSTVGVTALVSSWSYLLNQTEMITRYLRLSLWPDALVLDYGLPRAVSLREVLPSATVVVALLAATGVALVRWPKVGFLAASVFITLAPTSSIVPILSEVGAERRMYLPFAALATLAVTGARALLASDPGRPGPRRQLATTLLAAFVLGGLAVRTVARNAEYASPLTLWQTVVDRYPHGRARMAFATELATAGRHTQAIQVLRDALPDFPDARAALGTELILQGQHDEGAAILRQFIADDPSRVNRIPAHVLLAEALAARGNLDGAAAEWRAVLATAPSDAGARSQLARVLVARADGALRANDAARAEAYAREAVALAPRDSVARNLLGVALASGGKVGDALVQFREALQIAPHDTQARANLERALRASSDPATSTSPPRPRSGGSVRR